MLWGDQSTGKVWLRDAANASDAGAVEAEIWRIWGETDRDAQALC